MVRIAPVRVGFSPKTLWFDAGEIELSADDNVVVQTARGLEYGTLSAAVFDMEDEKTQELKSPLKPVVRLASEEDTAKADELFERSKEALPVFKKMARETFEDMNPIGVEFLFEGDKAVFYFESEERIDFRDFVRKLASEFHVRVDMKQIGVRDQARMVGGFGHCGQELCCRRLGGEFNPVSIRMAKEQDLSLNPQKISGVCGRLMCCLRYEFDAYKDFHTRAPKKNARIQTPEGEGKVVDLNVPKEIVSIQVGTEKPVKVPLAGMDKPGEGGRPTRVPREAWEEATAPTMLGGIDASALFSATLKDAPIANAKKPVEPKEAAAAAPKRSRRKRSNSSGAAQTQDVQAAKAEAKPAAKLGQQQSSERTGRRRRSTTVKVDGTTAVEKQPQAQPQDKPQAQPQSQAQQQQKKKQQQPRRMGKQRDNSLAKPTGGASVQVGRNSSALRAAKAQQESAAANSTPAPRKRRRRHRSSGDASKE